MNPIIEHLANLKFYADFKKSPAKNFDQYVEFIDSGAPKDFDWFISQGKPIMEKFSYDDPLEDAKFEDKVEDFLAEKEQEEQKPKQDTEYWFVNAESTIIGILERENAYILTEVNPFENLRRLLDRHDRLKKYVNISEKDFLHYSTWMQKRFPQDFFSIFSEKNNKVENYPLIHCFPRIFQDCKAYAFFLRLVEQKEQLNNADFSVIFHEMTREHLILCKQAEFIEFLNNQYSVNGQIYSEKSKKMSHPEFLPIYNSIFQEML